MNLSTKYQGKMVLINELHSMIKDIQQEIIDELYDEYFLKTVIYTQSYLSYECTIINIELSGASTPIFYIKELERNATYCVTIDEIELVQD